MFQDRHDAGQQLADLVAERVPDPDLVLGIPRGGLPVARPVAERLNVPLDIVAAKKMGMPGNPEFAIGAAASDGSAWVDDDVVERYDIDEEYIENERERAAETAQEKIETYREGREEPEMAGRTVLIVDDGVATGATARACLREVTDAGAERVILAVPVGPSESLADLEREADQVVVVEEPERFGAVGAHYREFGQVSDEEAADFLDWEPDGS